MAKKSKRHSPGEDKKSPRRASPVLEAFTNGDYVTARARFAGLAGDTDLPEGEREMAADMVAATGVDRGALWVAAACLAWYLVVILIAVLKQP